jgi:hypothetical protein
MAGLAPLEPATAMFSAPNSFPSYNKICYWGGVGEERNSPNIQGNGKVTPRESLRSFLDLSVSSSFFEERVWRAPRQLGWQKWAWGLQGRRSTDPVCHCWRITASFAVSDNDSFPQSRFGRSIAGIWKSHFYIWQWRNSERSAHTVWHFVIFGNITAFISFGYYNRIPQTGGLST